MKNRGFTLIETFGAITILILAVLGPLTLLSKSISDSALIKHQMTAAYLAQEALEAVINVRDQNIENVAETYEDGNKESAWLGPLASCVGEVCNIGIPIFDDNFSVDVCDGGLDDGCDMVLVEDTDLTVFYQMAKGDSGEQPTVFRREITIETEDAIAAQDFTPLHYFWSNESARVTVTVLYSFKGVPKHYSLSTVIYNRGASVSYQEAAPEN